jgi:hypothetical protein
MKIDPFLMSLHEIKANSNNKTRLTGFSRFFNIPVFKIKLTSWKVHCSGRKHQLSVR